MKIIILFMLLVLLVGCKQYTDFDISEYTEIEMPKIPTYIIVKHAEPARPSESLAIMFGTSNTSSESFGKGGILGHSLTLTYTVFVKGNFDGVCNIYYAGLDNPLFDNYIWYLYNRGVEIGLHTISPKDDNEYAIKEGLEVAKKYNAVTWVDHRQNKENVFNRASSIYDYYTTNKKTQKLLKKAGIKYIWGYDRKQNTSAIRIFKDKNFIYFESVGEYKNSSYFYSKEFIDYLIENKLTYISHSYLTVKDFKQNYENCMNYNNMPFNTYHLEYDTNRNVVTTKQFEKDLDYMKSKVDSGELRVTTMRDYMKEIQ